MEEARQPAQEIARDQILDETRHQDQGKLARDVDPALPQRGVFDLALGPGTDRGGLCQDRRRRQNFAADRIELAGESGEPGFRRGGRLLLRVLRRDQRLQLIDQLRARFFILQGCNELLQLLDRRRGRGARLLLRRGALRPRTEQRQEAERQEGDPRQNPASDHDGEA
jgi:hypothetical protein